VKASRRYMHRCVAVAVVLAVAVGATACSTLFGGGKDTREIRRIAILPFAYRAAGESHPCTLCPDDLVMAPTSYDDAMLVTAFFHEALTSYPRLSILPYETVERFRSDDMAESLDRLYAVEGIDAVLVGALMELRPRQGDPREPTATAGAAVYAALVEPLTQRVLWSGYRDENQTAPPLTLRRMSEIVSGEPVRWRSDLGQAQVYAEELAGEMIRRIH